ncbi:MAG TPA: carbamoyltransferase C-terminal domain-containing protein, partial [Candidatus Manganitrophaceae bacterium]|nr:carbamoyltransferase C-terminal domain-containing protein [Candidatus Manganitrophaceae bacterium]
AVYEELDDEALIGSVAEILASGQVVGWFQGRMEFGPRALGGRSILGDPRSEKMQSTMNRKIKFRESFRPFAPSVLSESASEFFDLDRPSPYMMLTAPVREKHRLPVTEEGRRRFGLDRLQVKRSSIPAVTHVDDSARVQTVHKETNRRFHQLIAAFRDRTGCPLLVNSSFNVRGEPIVCTPEEAYRCFMRTGIDYLVIENLLLAKSKQPLWKEKDDRKETFELD